MKKSFVIYDLSSDEIFGLFHTSESAEQTYPQEPNQGKILVAHDHQMFGEQRKWRVSAGVLVLKTEVVISSNKAQIIADGIDETTITFAGLVAPISVSFGEGVNQIVTPADPEIILTSDVPRQFVIEIDDTLHFAEPIFVEAQ